MSTTFQFDVFLSYAHADKQKVRRLAEKLRKAGLGVWLDEWVIRPGDDLYLAVEQGLEKSRCLILCMSQAAFGSEWVALERSTVLFRDPKNQQRRFIPLLLEECEIPDTIRRFAYVNGTTIDDEVLKRLTDICLGVDLASPDGDQGCFVSDTDFSPLELTGGGEVSRLAVDAFRVNTNLSDWASVGAAISDFITIHLQGRTRGQTFSFVRFSPPAAELLILNFGPDCQDGVVTL